MTARTALSFFTLFPLLGLALPARADTSVAGFALTRSPNPAPSSVACSLPDGDFVSFDGQVVARWNADGTLDATLASYASFVFPSFIRMTPDADAVVVGDSGGFAPNPAGDVRIVWLDGSGSSLLASIPYNFDGEFLPDGTLLVTAAPSGYSAGNDFFRVDLTSASTALVGHVDGPSGPIAISRGGDVFYGTQQDPSGPVVPQSILRWSAALLAQGVFLDNANATLYATGFEPPSALEFEPGKGRLHMSENNYSSAIHRIRRVRPGGQTSPILLTASSWISTLRFEVRGAGTFDAYQPGNGVRIAYTTTDFFSFDDLVHFAPARPELALSGAGIIGLGPVQFSLTGGVPNGSALLTYCPQSAILPQEASYPLPMFLLRTPFLLASTLRMPFLVPTDANGSGTLTLWNPGGMQGEYGWQFLVGRPDGTFVGASDAEQF